MQSFFSLDHVIDRQPLTVTPDTPLLEAIAAMQQRGNSCRIDSSDLANNSSCVLVVENNRLIGVFTERDLVRLIAANTELAELTLADVMSRDVVKLTHTGAEDIFTALNLLRSHRIRHLPIVDADNNLLGLTTVKNLRQKLQPMNMMRWRKVSEVMKAEVFCASPDDSIRHVAKLMAANSISCVAIVEAEAGTSIARPIGIITERDIVQFQTLNLDLEQPARQLMSAPLFLVSPDDTLWSVHQRMQQHRVRRLLVGGRNGELAGIITQTSLLQVFDPSEMYGVIESFQRQICELELERTRLLENRQSELEAEVKHRTAALEYANRSLQLEADLRREGEQRYNSILSSLEDLVWSVEPDTFKVIYMNSAAELIYQRPREEFYDDPNLWLEVVHPKDRDRVAEFAQNVLTTDSREIEYRIVRPNGEVRWLRDRATLIRDGEGVPIRLDGIATDISDRKQVKKKLVESNNLLRAIVDSVPECLELLDRDGKVLEINPAGLEMIEADTPAAIVGKTVYPLIFAEHRPAFIELTESAFEDRSGLLEYKIIGFKGTSRWLDTKVVPFKSGGRIVASLAITRDITQRKHSEALIKESRERYTLAVLGSSSGLWDWNIVTNEVFYAPLFKKILGYTDAEFSDAFKSWSSKLHPEDCDRVMAALQDHLENRVPYDMEYRLRKKDGEYCWVLARGQAIWNEQRQAVRMAGSITDISDRKRREEILKDIASGVSVEVGENLFPSLVEFLSKTLRVNFAFISKITGSEVREVETLAVYSEGKRVDNFVYSLSNTPCGNLIEQGLCIYPEAVRQLFPNIPRLEAMKAESYAGMPIFDADGNISGLIAVVDNKPFSDSALIEEVLRIFSARASTELERQQAETKIRQQAALLDIANDAIMVRDSDDRILFWNRGAEKLYGWSKAEAMNRNAKELFNRKSTVELSQIYRAVRERGEWQGELNQVTKADREIVVNSRWTPVKDEVGNPRAYLVVKTDITEQKQLEAQFLRTQRLESLGTLAGGIAHDLNNILAPILGFAKLLPLKLPDADEQTKKFLNIMETNAHRGTALVKQILTFSQGLEGEKGVVQIRHLINEIGQIITETFPRSIELTIDAPKVLWTVNADANQLHQVLMNLCVNARDAMPDGGKLAIEAENFTVDREYARLHLDAAEGNYLCITVTDTGVGILPEIIDRIFEPFFTTKEIGRGTGLGLFTVIGIVKNHGGFIDIFSKTTEMRGTKVKVFIPVADAEEAIAEAHKSIPRGNGELILVVDDETPMLEVTKATLEIHNYQVLTASNGIEAVAAYVRHKEAISIVIMDIMMPGMDGKTAIRTLKQINPELNIIAVSGLIRNKEIAAELNSDVTAFINKPFNNDDLLKKVAEIINS